MLESNSSTHQVGKRLTIRYRVALSLIALVLIGSYITIVTIVSSNEKDAYLVNISGKQRMLSQRIGLMVNEIEDSYTDDEAKPFIDKLRIATKTMSDNHKELSTDGLRKYDNHYTMSPMVHDMYFVNGGINDRVTTYITLANSIVTNYETGGLVKAQEGSTTSDIVKIAHNGLLNELNEVVTQYELEAETRINRFKNTELIVLLIGILVLIIEVIFIFKPMVKHVVRNLRALEYANAELLEFSYRISHDLRAPITSSLGLIDIASDNLGKDANEQVRTSLQFIKKSMTNLNNLIDDVLNLTKMKMSDMPVEEFSVNEMMSEVLAKLENLPNTDKIDIKLDIVMPDTITTKPMYVRQILENLISNAFKYYDPKKDKPMVGIKAKLSDVGECTIQIIDNGLGIPEDCRHQVFEMFKRFHPRKSFGSGLGLYLVKQNAFFLGGDVTYAPTEDGSKFELKFPLTSNGPVRLKR